MLNMIPIEIILLLFLTHFVSDFILQNDWMALNKSKDTKQGFLALTTHVLVIMVFLLPFGFVFAFANFVTHWLTDLYSSRAMKWLWQREKRHWFFVVLGFDQLLHYATLFYFYTVFGNPIW